MDQPASTSRASDNQPENAARAAETSVEDRKDDKTKEQRWADYLKRRENFEEAIDLLSSPCDEVTTRPSRIQETLNRYQTLKNSTRRDKEQLNKLLKSLNRERRLRAELLFFDPNRNKNNQLNELLKKILSHRYRKNNKKVDPIPLGDGTNARLLITVERLYQERIISLCKKLTNIDRGLPVSEEKEYRKYWLFYGPLETYKICKSSGKGCIESKHRTEGWVEPRFGQKAAQIKKERLGDSRVGELSTYFKIYYALKIYMDRGVFKSEELVENLLNFGTSHKAAAVAGGTLAPSVAEFLDSFSFFVMGKEQAAWQSAGYFQGQWNLGMTVSFARIMRLLEKKAIELEDVFLINKKCSLYATKSMYSKEKEVSDVCDKVDELYQEAFDVELTTQQAHLDLLYAYGGSADSDGDDYSED